MGRCAPMQRCSCPCGCTRRMLLARASNMSRTVACAACLDGQHRVPTFPVSWEAVGAAEVRDAWPGDGERVEADAYASQWRRGRG